MWPVLARLANTLWWVWLRATLVVLGSRARASVSGCSGRRCGAWQIREREKRLAEIEARLAAMKAEQ